VELNAGPPVLFSYPKRCYSLVSQPARSGVPMERFEVDRDSIFFLYDLYKSGRINFEPVYQRGRVWSNELRYALIDSIKEEFPIGLVMFNVVPHVDEDNTRIEKFDVVDGQQRMRTIMEYIDGAEWALVQDMPGFEPFKR